MVICKKLMYKEENSKENKKILKQINSVIYFINKCSLKKKKK